MKDLKNTFQSKYSFGDIVYLTTDADKKARIVTKVEFAYGRIKPIYTLSCGTSETQHYDIEFSSDKSYLNY